MPESQIAGARVRSQIEEALRFEMPHARAADLYRPLWRAMQLLGHIVEETEQSDLVDAYESEAQDLLQHVEKQLATLGQIVKERS